MSLIAIEGVVENGQIRLQGDVALPEHTKVFVVVPESKPAPTTRHLRSPRLVRPEQIGDFDKTVELVKERRDAGV